MSGLSQRLSRKLDRFVNRGHSNISSGKFLSNYENQGDQLPLCLEPSFLQSLEPSELNRLFLLISDSNGRISTTRQRIMQAYLDGLPPRPVRRIDPGESAKTAVRRSHLIDQFFAHRMEGITSGIGTCEFSAEQAKLRDAAQQGSEILKLAIEKLADAFPEVPKYTLGYDRELRTPVDEVQRAPKCPSKYMDGSVAVVLEHTEHITINPTRGGDIVNEM